MIRGTGWLPESRARRTLGRIGTVRRRIGALLAPESGGVLDGDGRPRAPWLGLDQRSRQACTGFAGAQLLYGLTGRKTSPWMLWQIGLLVSGYSAAEPLPNVGLRTSAVLRAYRQHGSCPYTLWNRGVVGFSWDRVPPSALRNAGQRNNLRVASLYGWGSSLVAMVIDALARGKPVGIVVDGRGLSGAGDRIIGPLADSRSDHMIVGWDFVRDGGSYVIRCVNSWNEDHLLNLSAERVGQSDMCLIGEGAS